MRRRAWIAGVLLPLRAGPTPDHLSAKRKFQSIQSETLRPGTRVTITGGELNAWIQGEFTQIAPAGVRQPRVELGSGTATGTALIDFVRIRQAQGKPPSWMAAKLLGGERPVRVTTRIRSQAGTATVDVERVEVSGVPLEGRVLDFLIRNYLLPNYPEAKVGQPFHLGYRIERIEVQPSQALVIIGR
jgi:hypothetical protein